ncbi:hypothetical protein BU24DRAFT_288335 [Aaosphaeria arxii CBS 175.79]|uniref:Uncharacterized protein n=1 Tax=Aaosphaeria arxii CBS 175.79 TaxID=1450172 RepID=A0A6A5XFY3_9PLEO|nr:uncharacterized protein BU24DRAFT_288335 [Aaosphaeria arxii CBS 175.79]KAF2011741.1 hypothetical protein BU24DRAFT_288335 [Aaosphaeria arxii CBS 175.79]
MPHNPRKVWRDKWGEKRPRTPGPTNPPEISKASTSSNVPNTGLQVAGLPPDPSPTMLLPAPKSWTNNTLMTHETRAAASDLFERYEDEESHEPSPQLQRSHQGKQHTEKCFQASLTRASLVGEPSVFTENPFLHDANSEEYDDRTTVRSSRPRLARYISDYLTFGGPDSPEFSEPWSQDVPLRPVTPVDITMVIQMIQMHIHQFPLRPLPVEHTSGLLRIFEEYRKAKEEANVSGEKWRDILVDFTNAQATWEATESSYQSEIIRLRSVIGKGASGMTGLAKAQQGMAMERQKTQRRPFSIDRGRSAYDDFTLEQLDNEIRSKSQQVHPARPSSPSEKMAVLSRHLSKINVKHELLVGTPPVHTPKTALSRKVKSELDLINMERQNSRKQSHRVPLPTTITPFESSYNGDYGSKATMDPVVETEAFVALRELATLVARRKGIDHNRFTSQVLELLFISDMHSHDEQDEFERNDATDPRVSGETSQADLIHQSYSHRSLEENSEQSQCPAMAKSRRHFSFEPGDDFLKSLNENFLEPKLSQELEMFKNNRPKSQAGSQSTQSSGTCSPSLDQMLASDLKESQVLGADTRRSSKIPSPVHKPLIAAQRRESSRSNSHKSTSLIGTRRISNSSIITTIRQESNEALLPRMSRGNSGIRLLDTEQQQLVERHESSRSSKSGKQRSSGGPALTAAQRAGRIVQMEPAQDVHSIPGEENVKFAKERSRIRKC